MKNKQNYIRAYSQEHYPIHRKVGTSGVGRKPNKLGITMRLMNIGDAFLYPYTTINSVNRLARQLDITTISKKVVGGFWVLRVG